MPACRGVSLSAIALTAGLLGACTRPTPAPPRPDGTAVVVQVLDGDTAIMDIGGTEESVRFLGIDTPEIAHPDQPDECFGPEATARTAALLPPGTAVRLERDLEARDRYDRILAYVHRAEDDLFVNESLVRDGFADTLSIEPNRAHDATLAAARSEARAAGRGLWGRCPDLSRLPFLAVTTLAERLGRDADARLLIVNCDDLGISHAANVGVYESLRDGLATSATLMVPCPWARDAAERYMGEDIGVHLTLNAEYERYRWGPITQAPSLLDGDGGFPRTIQDLWDHADLDEVRRECRAQIERAILWGFDVSHLDSHMGTLQLRPEFFDVYLELAVEFGLPLRLSGASTERLIGFPFRRLAAEEGVVFPDHFVYVNGRRQPPGAREGPVRPAGRGHRDLRAPGGRHPRAAGHRRRLVIPGRRPPPRHRRRRLPGARRADRRRADRLPRAPRAATVELTGTRRKPAPPAVRGR